MLKRYVIWFILYCFMILSLTGCWDEMNIEERNFVAGSALDLADGKKDHDITVSLTNQFVVPSGIGSPEGGKQSDKAFTNETTEGETLQIISHNLGTRTSRFPSYQHLKVLIFSEELAKEENMISKLSDMFIRDVDMRRAIKVFVSDGKAKEILNMKQDMEDTPAKFIDMLFERNNKDIETMDILRIGTMQEYQLEENSYLIPRVKLENGELHTDTAAVFHGPDDKLVGNLNARETKGYNFATKHNNEGAVEMNVDGNPMTYKLARSNSKIKVDVDEQHLHNIDAYIHVKAEGFLGEMYGDETVFKEDSIKKIQKEAGKSIERLIKETIEKSQKELHADILGVGQMIKRKHYPIWKRIHKDWENGEQYFDDVTFHVKVEANMKDVGTSDRTKKIR